MVHFLFQNPKKHLLWINLKEPLLCCLRFVNMRIRQLSLNGWGVFLWCISVYEGSTTLGFISCIFFHFQIYTPVSGLSFLTKEKKTGGGLQIATISPKISSRSYNYRKIVKIVFWLWRDYTGRGLRKRKYTEN